MKKALSIILIFLASLSLLSQTATKVYYPCYNEAYKYVYYCDLDGSNEDYFTVPIRPKVIAVDWNSDPKKLYIGLAPSTGFGKIIRCDLNGDNQEDVVTDLRGINGIELDLAHRKIYWLKNTYSDDYVYKADMDGTDSNIEEIYHSTTDARDLWGLAIDVPNQLLWITERGSNNYASYVKRMTTSGLSLTTIMNPANNPHDIEYYNGNLYLGTGDGVISMSPTGASESISVLVADAVVDGIAVDGTNYKIYWIDDEDKVKACNLNGSAPSEISVSRSPLTRLDTDYNPAALPVELTYFEGTRADEGVFLNWKTATEVNNYGFEVQKSEDRSQESEWEKIGFVQGHGSTNSPKNYEFTDSELPDADQVSYRLKQIDNDGTFAYSKIVTVDLTNITSVDDEVIYEFALEQNYPNPFNPTTKINFTVPTPPHPSPYQGEGAREGLVLLRVYDILGRDVVTLVNGELQPGNHEVTFDASNLSSGIYFYRIDVGSEFNSVRKMLVVK